MNIFLLLLAAIIWGFAFVAQKVGMEYIGPFTFNGLRFILGALSLTPLLPVVKPLFGYESIKHNLKNTVKGGVVLGIILFIAASLQQIGIVKAEVSNSGFITSLYIILVPFFGVFINHKITKNVWVGAVLAVTGLYLLSVTGNLKLCPGDGLVLTSAVFFAFHILFIGHYAPKTNVLLLSIIQFSVTALLSIITAFLFENITVSSIKEASIPILYGGILSIGAAYTLQVIAQQKVSPSKAAIVLSLESVFAALGGWLILDEVFTLRKIAGGVLMLTGLIISQIDTKKLMKVKTK